MRFNFREVRDGMGADNLRPVFPMRLAADLSRQPPLCLLETGSPDTFMARELADDAGIDLTGIEEVTRFPSGELRSPPCPRRSAA